MAGSVPNINNAHVRFIRPYVLPDFIGDLTNLTTVFRFLSSTKSYANYYTSFESGKKESSPKPKFISELGELLPLRKRHSTNSFWKNFRYYARRKDEFFSLMPLQISLKKVAEKEGIKGRAFAYIFQFGMLCINLEISTGYSILSFKKLIKKNVSERGKFMEWANQVAQVVNTNLFTPPKYQVDPKENHTLIFLDELSATLIKSDPQHAKAISGLITDRIDFENFPRTRVNEIISSELPKWTETEILIFNPKTTFLYPGKREWMDRFEKINTFACMRNNFADFLNLISTINLVIRSLQPPPIQMSKQRLSEIRRTIKAAFPLRGTQYCIEFFKNIFPVIANRISFQKKLKEFVESQ